MKFFWQVSVVFAALAAFCFTAQSATTLQLLGQAALPTGGAKGPGTEQVAFDDKEKVAYLIGDTKLYIIDLSPKALLDHHGHPFNLPRPLSVLQTVELPNTVNDVSFCGGYLALSANGPTKVLPGSVTIYSRYLRQQQHRRHHYDGHDDELHTAYGESEGDHAGSLELLTNFTVGALPDQLEFSKDCKTILVSNEGEPLTYEPPSLANDPEGSVSVINLHFCDSGEHYGGYDHEHYDGYAHQGCSAGSARVVGQVRTARFTAWNDKKQQLLANGVKIDGIDATVAQDLEPEYTTFAEDERIAFVSLQENNAVAVLDVKKAVITSIHALGFKNHNDTANPLDVSDRDGQARIITWPVNGMYQPDEMRSFRCNGVDYLVTANEGDARADWPGLNEETRVGNAKVKDFLDPSVFQDIPTLTTNPNMGRLNVLTVNGKPFGPFSDPNDTGKFQKLFSFGARSFSIWKLDVPHYGELSAATLTQVFDSAAQLEQLSRDFLIDIYNSELGNVGGSSWDGRSDNKGPEPEGVAIGPCNAARSYSYEGREYGRRHGDDDREQDKEERLCLFLGTERLGVIFVYDITNPYKPVMQSFARPPRVDLAGTSTALSAPEGVAYARYSLGHKSFPVVLVAYEASVDNAALPAGLGVYMVTDDDDDDDSRDY